MSIFDRERSEIAKLFSEELELGLYSLSSEATYRVISVDGIPAQHTILISCYNDEVYLPFESRSNTNRLTVTDLDYDVRYGQVVNHANIDMRVLNDGMNAENYNSDIYIPSNTKALEIINTLKQSSVAVSIGHQPQCVKLKQAAIESRTASAKLAEKNASTDCPCGRDER